MQQPIHTPPILTPVFRELRPQQEAALRQGQPDQPPPDLAPGEQMRRIEREEEPERWDGLS